jgi:hypothetical protein
MHSRLAAFAAPLALCLLTFDLAAGQAAAPQGAEEIEAFMRGAKVVRTRTLGGGITRPLRLTLTDGVTTHDAVFQAVDEKKAVFVPTRGPTEINFVDSWRYNIAAYRLARLVGLDWMMPVTIEYRYQGRPGALSWWMESIMDERTRLKKKVRPPDALAWNHDMYRMRIFASLVHDSDRNLGNVLVSPAWRVIMLDFTRAFRLYERIQAEEIERCDRALFERLEALTPEALKAATGEYLTGFESEMLMKRRDLLVAHIRNLIAARGEDKVLY